MDTMDIRTGKLDIDGLSHKTEARLLWALEPTSALPSQVIPAFIYIGTLQNVESVLKLEEPGRQHGCLILSQGAIQQAYFNHRVRLPLHNFVESIGLGRCH